MATEADKVNNGAMATLIAVVALGVVGVALAVTAPTRMQQFAERDGNGRLGAGGVPRPRQGTAREAGRGHADRSRDADRRARAARRIRRVLLRRCPRPRSLRPRVQVAQRLLPVVPAAPRAEPPLAAKRP